MWTTCPDRRRQGGFAIVAGIVILVVLAALAGFVVSISTTQHVTFTQDLQGARAYQAARAGIEWGAHKWLSTPASCTGTTLTFAGTDLAPFQTVVTATSHSGGKFCEFKAIATIPGTALGSMGYVERELSAVIESQ